ncbi:MAG: DUF2752 domain-containing protein [Bacteroidia bacterium]
MIHWLEQHLSSCFFKSRLGIECPGCGMQRAFIALLKGDLSGSLHYHPALLPFLLTITVLIAQLFIKHPKGGLAVMWLFILTTAITVANYIIRQYLYFSAN